MSVRQLDELLKYLPAGTTTFWVMVTPYFNRPPGQQCDTGLQAGLGVIAGFLGLLCWIRAMAALYSCRNIKRGCNRGPRWMLVAALEASGITAMFIAIALVTPPGSTCFFPAEYWGSTVNAFTAYNVLAGASLLAFSLPRATSWLQSLLELLGIKVRRLQSEEEKGAACALKRSGYNTQHTSLWGFLFFNDRLEWYVWQLLPSGTVTLYQVATAYWSEYRSALVECTTEERSWLIVFVSIIGVSAFFTNLESYEKDCLNCNPPISLFRSRGILYRIGSLIASLFSTAAFVAVALLTPPGSYCFFLDQYLDNDIAVIGQAVLAPVAAATVLFSIVRAFFHAHSSGQKEDQQLKQVAEQKPPQTQSQFVASSV